MRGSRSGSNARAKGDGAGPPETWRIASWLYITPFDEPERAQLTRSEEHTSELQSLAYLVCRLLLEKKKRTSTTESDRVAHTTRPPTLSRCRLWTPQRCRASR